MATIGSCQEACLPNFWGDAVRGVGRRNAGRNKKISFSSWSAELGEAWNCDLIEAGLGTVRHLLREVGLKERSQGLGGWFEVAIWHYGAMKNTQSSCIPYICPDAGSEISTPKGRP